MNTIEMNERHQAVLQAAYNAWMAGSTLRRNRLRNKRFTYGDQWGDLMRDERGRLVTEGEHYCQWGQRPITNNMIRQLVKTIVGRYRAKYMTERAEQRTAALNHAYSDNSLDEIDARALEEFLISGCCVQRIDHDLNPLNRRLRVDNVPVGHFFINAVSDARLWDCELIGQLHDVSVAHLVARVAAGQRRKAAWVRRLYSEQVDQRIAQLTTALGCDSQTGTDFWRARDGKCRLIEVWTLESREVMLHHNKRTAELSITAVGASRRPRTDPDVTSTWEVCTVWHCRWFSPMGDVLLEYDSPWPHGSHPFVAKFYPLTDGEVHALVEDVIDQQKFVNRLVTVLDQIMAASAKGVLLYPETALPDGYTWEDVRRIWSSTGGILPYSPQLSDARPEQIINNGTNSSAFDMINLQMKMLEQVSGVPSALQGRTVGGNSASLYEQQAQNAEMAMTDIFDTFTHFTRERDSRLLALLDRNETVTNPQENK